MADIISPTSVARMYDLFPNTKPALGKYTGVISGLLRNLAPREVLASGSPFNTAGAVHDAQQDAAATLAANAAAAAEGKPVSPAPSPTRQSLDLLYSLCDEAKKVFDAESVIINVKVEAKDRLVLVGDIHGQFRDMQQHVLSQQRVVASGATPVGDVDCKYLFLGDYVDRGPQGVEVITLLLALKVEYPNNVFMIRGNHEDAQVSRLYGFLAECKAKLDIGSWGQFNEVFNTIPLGATVECETGSIFCCHGGLSPGVESIAALQFLNRADYGNGLCDDSGESIDGLLWSDPGEHKGFRRNMRGCGYTFGTDTTSKFCESNGVSFVCRAHQMVMAGYQWEHDHRLLTLFSAPNYCGINHNNGAIAIVMGSEANQKYLENKAANPTPAAAASPAEKKEDDEAAAAPEATAVPVPTAEEEEAAAAAKAAAGITIPIAFYSFPSAPSVPCTLYYTTAFAEATSETDGLTADSNGSPVSTVLRPIPALSMGLPLAGIASAPAADSGDVPIPCATPRPPADPNLNIAGLQYFGGGSGSTTHTDILVNKPASPTFE